MSKTEKYYPFFSALIQDLNKQRPRLGEFKVQPRKNWVKICQAGRPDFHFSCSFSRDGFRVNLTFQAKNERDNKAVFDALEQEKAEIEKEIGHPLDWRREHGLGVKRSDICARIPGQITDPSPQLEEYRRWAVKTIINFVDTFQPRIRKHLHSSR